MIKIIKTFSLILLSFSMIAGCSEKKDDSSKTNLLALAALSSRSSSASTATTRDMYTGFADIPSSIYKTVASGATASVQGQSRTLATTDYKFQNSANDASVSKVYDLVRGTAKTTRDIAKSIGDIVKALEVIPVTTAIEGSNPAGSTGWANLASKYKFQPSTILSGGKKLEVWWNNAPAPFANNKAIEMNYTGSSTSGNMSGFVFVRFTSVTNATTLSKAYIRFDYNATTSTRSMVVILQDIGPTFTDKAHFFVQEVNGVTSMDGTYTVNNFNANSNGVAVANRAYVFSAIGNSTKAVINAAFPLATDNTTAIYANTAMGNIGQVWTNFIFANPTIVALVQGVSACAAPSVVLTPTNGNPTGGTVTGAGVTTVAALKACLDTINPSVNAKDVYFLTNIKNPAYFNVSGNTVSLYGVESLETSDTNKAAFDVLQNNASFLSSTRTTANTTYAAALDAVSVSGLNLFTGTTGVPTGSSATDLTKLNAQWGNGTPGTGTSASNAGTNTVNGSKDDTAPF